MAEDAVKVTFNGNGYTGGERASDFSLLRVAEIAALRGFSYFVLISENSAVSTSKTPDNYQITGYGNSATMTNTGGWIILKPSTTNVAKLLKKKPENFGGIVYSPSFGCNNIIKKYDLSQYLFCNDMVELHSEWVEIMHIQVVTFTSDINRRDYENMVIEGAPVWAAVSSLIIKHFVYNFEEH